MRDANDLRGTFNVEKMKRINLNNFSTLSPFDSTMRILKIGRAHV